MIFRFLSIIAPFNVFRFNYWSDLFWVFFWCFYLKMICRILSTLPRLDRLFWSTDGRKGSLWAKQHCVAWVRSSNIWIRTITATLGFSFFYVALCYLIGFHLSIRTWLINQCQPKKSLHRRRGANPQLWLAVGPTHTYQEQQTVYYIYIHICVHRHLYRTWTLKIWSIYITLEQKKVCLSDRLSEVT